MNPLDDATILEAKRTLANQVFTPLTKFCGETPSCPKAQQVLRECFDVAERLFSQVCRRRSIEFWLPFARGVSGQDNQIISYEAYLTQGLLKYCNLTAIDVIPIGKESSNFKIALHHTADDLLDVQRLAHLAFLMACLGNAYRRIGKGSVLKPKAEDLLNIEASESVAVAIKSYDSRRPHDEIFRDQGIMHNVPLETAKLHFIEVGKPDSGTQFVVREWGKSWPCIRFPMLLQADAIVGILEAYRDAIEDIYRVPLASVFHFLAGLAAITSKSMPVVEDASSHEFRLRLRDGDDESAWRKQVEFLVNFSEQGYFRFPLEHWLDVMATVRSPWAGDENESRKRTEQFLTGFNLKVSAQTNIDLSTLRPVPFCLRSSNDWVYVDVQATSGFLRSLVDSGKEWFATQGGDRFTLAVKRRIEAERSGVTVVDWKKKVAVADKKRPVEIDLLLATDSTLFVVECKAFAKSPDLYRGDCDAVTLRTLTLKEALRQAHKEADAVQQAISNGDTTIPKRKRMEVVVCMPAQEFILPVDAFGFIAGKIPRICTPEELLEALTLMP